MTTNEKPLRAVGYCRTSGEGQRDNTSIANQQDAIKTFCQQSGWSFMKHYVDECKSGAKVAGREEFEQMMEDAALGLFDLIIPYDVSRFARDGVDILENARRLKANFSVHVVDTRGGFDSRAGNTSAVLLNFVHAGVSEYERLKIMERMIGGRIRKAQEGKRWSGRTPFGRAYDKATGKWTLTERGLRMRQLLERYVQGASLLKLLKEFTEFKTPEVVFTAVRTSQLSGVYVKEFNIADLGIKGMKIPIPQIPEVITPELEVKVRAWMAHLRRWNKEDFEKYVLTGFVRCGHCNRPLSGNSHDGTKYYRHTFHLKHEIPRCVFHGIRDDQLVPAALDFLYSFFTDEPTFNAAVAQALPDQDEVAAIEKERATVQESLDKVERDIAALVNAILKGIDPVLLMSKQDGLKHERSRLSDRLAHLDAKRASMPNRETVEREAMGIRLALLEKIQERDWRKLDFDEIKRFLVFLFGENPGETGDGIIVTQEEGRWRFTFKGRVSFYHDVVNGRPVSHLVRAEAARHNKAALAFLRKL